ncbi:MAG: twin-arginine translocation signal domain-containing protein, partial [Prosthecobacter sp.]
MSSSRRHFLQSAASTALLAATGGAGLHAQEAAKPAAEGVKRKLRKAIMGGTLGIKGTLLEKYTAAKTAGYEGVEPAGGMNQQEVLDALGQSGLQA